MEKAYRRFAVGLLVALGILFLLCAAVVIRIDPFFHYRDVDPILLKMFHIYHVIHNQIEYQNE